MKLLAVLLSFALAGCGAPLHHQGQQSLARGDTATAERQFKEAIRDGDFAAWTSLGVLYQRQGKMRAAIDAYNMGARYGEPTARSNLANLRQPIPAADLVGKQESDSAALGGLLNSFSDGYSSGVNCTTYTIGNDYAKTRCR